MKRSTWRALAALAALGSVVAAPAVAQAHPPAQQLPDATYYRTEIQSMSPAPAGVTARVDPGGEWLELSASGSATVVVLGYTGEPYLRLSSGKAEENELSQTTYLNRSLFADTVPTAQSPTTMAPAWHQIGATGTVRWHDHRIHWMGQARPPAVAADPTRPHLVGSWTVHATAGGAPFDINGALTWTGKPAGAGSSPLQAWLFTVLAGLLVAVGVLTIALARSRRQPRAWSLRPDDAAPAPGTREPVHPVGADTR